jgi:filamentous hemagglutinin family protein
MLGNNRIAVLLVTVILSGSAVSNPSGGVVSSGSAVITQAPGQTTIQQNSQQAIINWQGFNIGAGEKTHFQQPQGGMALNRISATQGPSQIYGQLTATGKIILVNQAGIFFGPGSYVNVGGIIASTSNISDQNFLTGKLIFDQPSIFGGSIVNRGTIIASQNGLVALLGSNVTNDGMIQAQKGSVILASGNKFTVDLYGDQLINFAVDEGTATIGVDENGSPAKDAIINSGSIFADGGQVFISAKSASSVIDNVINMSGVVQARSVDQKNGVIILSGDSTAPVVVYGILDASGKSAGQKGGKVKVLGKKVLVNQSAKIDVSGDNGGGEILIGGNYQGLGPEKNAEMTAVASGAYFNADAITQGNGGRIIVWADDATQFYGQAMARGGQLNGDGGFIETSGHRYLDIQQAQVDLSAVHGSTGTWLLDPWDVTISNNAQSSGFNGGSPTNTFTPTANSDVNVTTLQNNLAAANVIITTGSTGGSLGNITVSVPITWASANSLTLTAANNIIIDTGSAITNSSTGSLNLNALGTIAINSPISLTGGTLTLSAQSAETNASSITTGASGSVNVNSFVLSQGGWNQVNASLPTFSVSNNFQATSNVGTSGVQFVRALSGNGASASTPYILADIYGFQGIGSSPAMLTKFYKLNNNISAVSTSTWNSGAGFRPLGSFLLGGGNDIYYFTGALDGDHKIVSDITINQYQLNEVGVFRYIDVAGRINNLGVENINLTAAAGYVAVGGLTGSNAGEITDSYTTGTIQLLGVTDFVGGLVGSARGGKIQGSGTTQNLYSYSSVDITAAAGSGNSIGGLVGITQNNDSLVNNAYATGTITLPVTTSFNFVGGLLGWFTNDSTISNSFSSSVISAPNSSQVGGLVGYITPNSSARISTSYSLGAVTGLNQVGGLVGSIEFSTVENSYSQNNAVATNGSVGGLLGYVGSNVTLQNSFAANTVTRQTGSGNVGQLVGDVSNALSPTYTNNYWDSNLQSSGNGVGGTSKTTAQLQTQSTFTSWDFGSTWTMVLPGSGFTYPHLAFENAYGYQGQLYTNAGITLASPGTLVTAYTNGSVTPYAEYNLNSSREYGFVFRPVDYPVSTNILLTSAGTAGNLVFQSNETTVLSKAIWGGYVIAGIDASQTLTNNILSGAQVGGALYGVDGSNNLTLNSGIHFLTNSIYTPNGNVTTSGSGTQTYNYGISLGTDTVFTSTNSAITFNSTISNSVARALTISAGTAAVTLNGSVGSVTSLNSINFTGNGAINLFGNMTTSGSQTYMGPITLGASVVLTGSDINANSLINGSGFGLTINGSGTSNINGIISGSNTSLTKLGGGTLILGAANTYTGATTINNGTIRNGVVNALPTTTALTVNSSGVYNLIGSNQQINSLSGDGTVRNSSGAIDFTVGSGTFSGVIGDSTFTGINLIKSGGGTLTLSGASGYTGTTTVNGGILSFDTIGNSGANTALGNTNSAISLASGTTLQYTGTGSSSARPIVLNGTGGILDASGAGGLTLSGGVTGDTFGLVLTGAGAGTVSGISTTSGALTKNGGGTWVLAGSNTYTGATIINNGTIRNGVVNALPTTTALTINSPGIYNLIGSNQQINSLSGDGTVRNSSGTIDFTVGSGTFSGVIGDSTFTGINLIKSGGGTLTLSGASGYVGTTTVNGGILSFDTIGNSGTNTALGNTNSTILLASGATLLYTGTGSSSARPIVLTGTGGILDASGTGGLTLGGVTGDTFGLVLTGAGTGTVSGISTTSGALTKNGGGTWVLAGSNTHAGPTTVNAGTLQAGAVDVLSSSSLNFTGAGTFDFSGYNQTINGIASAIAGSVIKNTGVSATLAVIESGLNTFAGSLEGALNLIKLAGGTLVLSNANNTYTGATTINNGTIRNGIVDALPTTTALSVNGPGVYNLIGFNQQVGSLSGTGSVRNNVAAADAVLTVGNANTSNTFSGVLTNDVNHSLSLTKVGTGTLTLSGSNTYTGQTTVENGTLKIENANGLGSVSNIVVKPVGLNTAILDLSSLTSFANTSGTITTDSSNGGAAEVNFPGSVTISNPLVVTGDNNIFDTESGTASLSGSISGDGSLTLQGSGAINLLGSLSTTLASLTSNIYSLILSSGITTVGAQVYTAGVQLSWSGAQTLGSSGGDGITFGANSNLSGAGSQGLNIADNSGAVSLLGEMSNLASLTVGTGSPTTLGSSGLTTIGNQNYGSAITLSEDTTLTTLTGNMSLNTVNGNAKRLNLIGGVDNNNFIFLGDVTGASGFSLNGGGGINSIDFSALATNRVVSLTSSTGNGFSGVANLSGMTFTDIADIKANASQSNSLTGVNTTPSTWIIYGNNTGNYNNSSAGLTFANFQTITAGSMGDSFSINAPMSGAINGGSGNDIFYLGLNGFAAGGIHGAAGDNTLVGANNSNFAITGSNVGNVDNGIQNNFTGIQNITGSGSSNQFTFADGATISGNLNGSGTDTLNISAYTSPVSVSISGASTLVGGVVSGVTQFIGTDSTSATHYSTIIGSTGSSNVWSISGLNNTTLGGRTFTGFANISGASSGNNQFNFAPGSSVYSVKGSNSGVNVLNYNNYGSAVAVNLQTAVASGVAGNFSKINSVVGDASLNGTVIASNIVNVWNLSGIDSGTVTGLVNGFTQISNLVGGLAVDTFNFASGARVTGSINGGSGNNVNKMTFASATNLVLSSLSSGNILGVVNFNQIQQANNLNGAGNLTLPSDKRYTVVYYDGTRRNGEIGDPFYFYGFNLTNPPPIIESLPTNTVNVITGALTDTDTLVTVTSVNDPGINQIINDIGITDIEIAQLVSFGCFFAGV